MTELVDAQFYTSLKTTLVPTNGAGTPTFTRATTKNVFDNEGKLITVKSGAVTLGGARVVQNLYANSEDFTTYSAYICTVTNVTTATPFSASGTISRVTANAVAGAPYVYKATPAVIVGDRVVITLYLKALSHNYIQIYTSNTKRYVNFDISTGVVGTIGTEIIYADIVPADNGWYRIGIIYDSVFSDYACAVSFVTSASAAWNSAGTYSGTEQFYIFGQALDTSNKSITALNLADDSNYISSGDLSSPYHGAGADGVKYFDTDSSGVAIPDATMLGAHIDPASKTNNLLWCRDLTNAAWVKTNATAAKTQTGIDAVTSACSLLTAAAANATALQTITAASTPACSGFWVKRSVGTGSVFFTRNGGTDWLDITSLINSSTFTCIKIENTSVTNPKVGFKIASSGDAIIVDAGLNHAGTTLTLPILTTSAAVTRAADVLTYQTTSNFSDTAGTILATYKPTYDTYSSGSIVGSSTRGLYASASNSGVQALDGTNTINGPAGTPSGQIKIGARWSGSSLQCFALDSFGSSGSYDGSFNLSTIGILPGTAGYIRDLAIWTSSLNDNEISDAWNQSITYITSGSLVGMQSILSSSTSSISTVIYGSITATYVQPTLAATYTVPTIEAEI